MNLAFRPADLTNAQTEDARAVLSNWSSSYKQSYTAGIITSDDWADIMHRQIWKHVNRPGAQTIIAFEKEDPSFIYGWVCGDVTGKPVVFYTYVKESFRRAGYREGQRIGDGIARRLFGALGVDPARPFEYACQTPLVFETLRDKIPRARWNPRELRYPKDPRRERWQKR